MTTNTSSPLEELRHFADRKRKYYQACLDDIELCEILTRFGDKGPLDRSFFADLNWLLETWLNNEGDDLFDARRVVEIEDKLEQIPFVTALLCKTPTDLKFANSCLDDSASDWRTNVSKVMTMTKEEQLRIHSYFEYMCYFVINAQEELQYDIQCRLLCPEEPEP